MNYKISHLRRLNNELGNRFQAIQDAISFPPNSSGYEFQEVDGVAVRLAIDDFKTILAEIRKLK